MFFEINFLCNSNKIILLIKTDNPRDKDTLRSIFSSENSKNKIMFNAGTIAFAKNASFNFSIASIARKKGSVTADIPIATIKINDI